MSIAYVSGDVSRDETLLSYKIADMSIAYVSRDETLLSYKIGDMSIAYVSRDVSRDTAHIYAHI